MKLLKTVFFLIGLISTSNASAKLETPEMTSSNAYSTLRSAKVAANFLELTTEDQLKIYNKCLGDLCLSGADMKNAAAINLCLDSHASKVGAVCPAPKSAAKDPFIYLSPIQQLGVFNICREGRDPSDSVGINKCITEIMTGKKSGSDVAVNSADYLIKALIENPDIHIKCKGDALKGPQHLVETSYNECFGRLLNEKRGSPPSLTGSLPQNPAETIGVREISDEG